MSEQLTILSVPYESLGRKENEKEDFEAALRESIDEVLSSLGENVKQNIYSLLEKDYAITKEMIPYKPNAFVNALEATFGNAAKLVEIRILEKLHAKIRSFTYKSGKSNLLFADYLKALRSNRPKLPLKSTSI
jgi:hypothetical protein